MPDNTLVTVAIGVGVALAAILIIRKLSGAKRTNSTTNTTAKNPIATSQEKAMANAGQDFFLNRTRQTVPLTERIQLSHDTYLFRFGLPTPDTVLGLPVGKHFKVYGPNPQGCEEGKWNGRPDSEAARTEIERKYTPVSSDSDRGHFDLVIKVYRPNERFSDGGKMSQYIASLEVGQTLDIEGPFGLVEYIGNSEFNIKRKKTKKTHVGMIAGGTGITPMLQIIAAVLKDPKDTTQIWLLFANQTEEDILVRDELERYASENPDRFHLWYTLDRPNEDWKYSQGFVNEPMLREHMPPPSPDTVILMCGPEPMIKFACLPNLEAIGHAKEAQVAF